MNEILLPYGERPLRWVAGPGPVAIVRCNDAPPLPDPDGALRECLRDPLLSRPLRERARGCGRVAVVVSDGTRLFPQGRILRAVIDELSVVPSGGITIVVGGGSHEVSDPATLGLDGDIASRFRVVSHDARDGGSMRVVGTLPGRARGYFLAQALRHIASSIPRAPRGAGRLLRLISRLDFAGAAAFTGCTAPCRAFLIFGASFRNAIRIRREVADADLRVLIGQIKPHFLAGFSGGLKAVFPGCAGRTCIAKNHLMMNHPTAALGRAEGNIIRESIEAAGRLCGESFLVNVVMDGENRVAGVFAGDPVAAHRKGAELCRRIGEVEMEAADIVVAAEGFPEAVNLYQLTKIIPPASAVVRKGGAIVCVGACRDGVGGLRIVNDITVRIGFRSLLPRNVRLYLVSDLPKRVVDRTEFVFAGSVEEAVERERRRRPGPLSVAALSGAGLLIPQRVA